MKFWREMLASATIGDDHQIGTKSWIFSPDVAPWSACVLHWPPGAGAGGLALLSVGAGNGSEQMGPLHFFLKKRKGWGCSLYRMYCHNIYWPGYSRLNCYRILPTG